MFLGHDMDKLTRNSRGGINESDSRPCNFLQDRQEERIMSTAQDNDVGIGFQERFKACGDNSLCFRPGQPARLDKFHETGTDMLDDIDIVIDTPLGLQVLGAFERPGCREHADDAGAGTESGRLDRRLHADEADVVMPA